MKKQRGGERAEVTIVDAKIDRELAHLPASRIRKEFDLERERAVLRAKLAKLGEEREGKPCEAVILGGKVDYQLLLPLEGRREESIEEEKPT